MWPFIKPLRLIRYLVVLRVNASLVRLPRCLPAELSLAVESALARLTAEQREAVLLKIFQGFKFEEIAEALDCPVSTVKSRVYTALDLLKE